VHQQIFSECSACVGTLFSACLACTGNFLAHTEHAGKTQNCEFFAVVLKYDIYSMAAKILISTLFSNVAGNWFRLDAKYVDIYTLFILIT
jgi:hypothetical protein